MEKQNYLSDTPILNFRNEHIQRLIKQRQWSTLDEYKKIGAAYDFVRNEIRFGYNRSDDIPATDVLKQGYGQCNTKGNLLMALLRALDIPCRLHGFTIDNQLQKGAIPSFLFHLAPKYILHSWVDVFYQGRWLNLEGFILDQTYLHAIQQKFQSITANFCGYGIATTCLKNPEINWQGKSTYIQKEGIHDDFGTFNTPDEFYAVHGTNLKGLKRFLFQSIFRHLMNWNVNKLRQES